MENLLTTDACTLPTAERPLRLAEFDDLFATSVRGVRRRGDGVLMQLTGTEGLVERVRDLAARETACCSFFTFELTPTDDHLSLRITVPPTHADVLDALSTRYG